MPTPALTLTAVRANIGCRFVGPTFPSVLCFEASLVEAQSVDTAVQHVCQCPERYQHKVTHQSIAAPSKNPSISATVLLHNTDIFPPEDVKKIN